MADFAQTITETISLLGMGELALWGTFEWGEDWGYTGELETEADKCLSNSMTFAEDRFHDFEKAPIGNSLDFDETGIEAIMRAYGIWDNVFTKPTTDGDEKIFDESTPVSDTDTSWTASPDDSSSWEDV
jgi:hypothetical protein